MDSRSSCSSDSVAASDLSESAADLDTTNHGIFEAQAATLSEEHDERESMSLIVVFALFQKAVAVCGTRVRETPRRESVRAPADPTLAAGGNRPRGAGAVTKTPLRTYASARGRSVVRARESCVGWFAPFSS